MNDIRLARIITRRTAILPILLYVEALVFEFVSSTSDGAKKRAKATIDKLTILIEKNNKYFFIGVKLIRY